MKKHLSITSIFFLAFLACMTLGWIFLPRQMYSESEKRQLARFPELSSEAVFSGEWGGELEGWLADHLPLRSFFVGLDAYKDLLLGQQDTKDIRFHGGRLAEGPVQASDAAIDRNLTAIARFAEGREVTFALVPSAGWAAGWDGYADDAIIGDIYARAKAVQTVDLTADFAGKPERFYRTDHHWTSEGAFAGYRTLMTALNRPIRESYERERISQCFQGSTYSRSALWLTEPEDLELWVGSEALTVVNGENSQPHEGVFYRERLTEGDKYTVFLDGNHSLVRIANPNQTGKLLVIRDSFSNCLGCFLAESYGEVVLADLRYYKQPVSLLLQEGFDDVVILYSLGNFLTDTNLVMLR